MYLRTEVERTLAEEGLLPPKGRVLVGVSGGVDSMVLLDVLLKAGHPCTVIHVDHGLRGAESDADRAFVEDACARLAIACIVERVDVKAARSATDDSVQMAARRLRYAIFQRLAQEHGCPVALAHHRDDATETVLINLMRGAGVAGFGGIPVRSGPVVRPLLRVGRADIQRHAASNADPKYLRNRVRHELLPLMEDLRPGAGLVIARSLRAAQELRALAEEAVDDCLQRLEVDGNTRRLGFAALTARSVPLLVLQTWLGPLGFHPNVQAEIWAAVQHEHTGASFLAGPYRLYVDRAHLDLVEVRQEPLHWHTEDPRHWPPGTPLRVGPAAAEPSDPARVLWLDPARSVGPYVLRPWRAGDRMQPSGMSGTRSIADMLVDAKVPRSAKERVLLLTAADEVLWLVGMRVAEAVRSTTLGAPGMIRLEFIG